MHVLSRKLRALHNLSEDEESVILDALGPPEVVAAGCDIASDGEAPSHSTVLLSGVACRSKIMIDGRRQILAFQFPGDFSDLYAYVLKRLDHSIMAMSSCTVARVPHEVLSRLAAKFPNLAYTLWRDTMVDSSIFQMWLVNVGQRPALARLAHLLCEQFFRLQAVGLARRGEAISLPITQEDLADATGMSTVHVNRTMQELRRRGLVGRNPTALEILDWHGLAHVAGFDAAYLHYRHFDSEAGQ